MRWALLGLEKNLQDGKSSGTRSGSPDAGFLSVCRAGGNCKSRCSIAAGDPSALPCELLTAGLCEHHRDGHPQVPA